MSLTLPELVKASYENSKAHGFHEGEDPLKIIPEKLALIHSEISEALEFYRNGNQGHAINENFFNGKKPDGFTVELADALIRIFDLAGQLDLPLEAALRMKMIYNESRPYKHGKVC